MSSEICAPWCAIAEDYDLDRSPREHGGGCDPRSEAQRFEDLYVARREGLHGAELERRLDLRRLEAIGLLPS